ncbi:hypothetical protein NFI96_007409 [Prochilodus magdalenae]|nr:hypothetical protein NFI96_007409 [Prochilodus magdalenae]
MLIRLEKVARPSLKNPPLARHRKVTKKPEANGTHFIYENSIQGVADSAGGPINRKKELELRFSCVYKLRQTLTMEFSPLQSIVHKTLPDGKGMYQVRMIPYQDAAFSHPYNGTEDIEVDAEGIFLEVTLFR